MACRNGWPASVFAVALLTTAVAAIAGDAAAAAATDDTKDNPQFVAWGKFEVGATATLVSDVQVGRQRMSSVSAQKLVEKHADRVVVEVATSIDIGGQKRTLPAQRQTFSRKEGKAQTQALPDEQVTAAGETFACKVMLTRQPIPQGGGEVDAKLWVSEKVPGGVVKIEAKLPQGTVVSVLKAYSLK